MKHRFSPRDLAQLRRRLLKWFEMHRRALPWRTSRDAYRVWIAEIMLQQTRIAVVIPYYERFLREFPTVNALADAPIERVLRLWSGLGYYSRARNLHRAAREMVLHHGAEFPRTLEAALALPGVGRYTAAAILSISYDMPLAALDGNVARVLARLGAIRGDLRAPGRWQSLGETAQHLLPVRAAGDWNQALMELGELICTPRNPQCGACPIARFCRARALGLAARIPAARRKRAVVKIRLAAAILRDPRGRVLLVRDPGAHDGVLFSRMWQFPAVQVMEHAEKELAAHLLKSLNIEAPALDEFPAARHGVTYRDIALLPFLARVPQLPKLKRTRILHLDDLESIPISSATRKIAAAIGTMGHSQRFPIRRAPRLRSVS